MFDDINDEFKRAYYSFLLEETPVSPKKDFEIDVLGKKLRFVQGEEILIPRWLAEILSNNDLVDIKEDLDLNNIIGEASQLSILEKKSPTVLNIPNIILRLKLFLQKEKTEHFKSSAMALLKKLVEFRSPKIAKLAMRKSDQELEAQELDPLEKVLYTRIRSFYEKWVKRLFEEELK